MDASRRGLLLGVSALALRPSLALGGAEPMPLIRSYPEAGSLQATDALVIDRESVGTMFIEGQFLGQSVAVEDEGAPLTDAASLLNFVGAGVTATAVGSAVTVTIPGGAGSSPTAFRISLSDDVDDIYTAGIDAVLQGIAIFDSVDFDTDAGSASLTRNLQTWFSSPDPFPVASYAVPTAGYYQFTATFSLFSSVSETWGFFAQMVHLTADQSESTDSFGTNVTQTFAGAISSTENVSITVTGATLCAEGDIVFPNIIANHGNGAGINLNGGGGPPGPFLPTFFSGFKIA